MAGRGTQATIALERAGVPFTVHEYAHEPRRESYGLEASQALGVSPDRVFKTLVAEVDGALAVGVVPLDGQLASLRSRLGIRRKYVSPSLGEL